MPRYTYLCEKCSTMFDVVHPVPEVVKDCSTCGEKNSVTKFLGTPFKKKHTVPNNVKIGSVVHENINKAKEELKEEKKKLRSR